MTKKIVDLPDVYVTDEGGLKLVVITDEDPSERLICYTPSQAGVRTRGYASGAEIEFRLTDDARRILMSGAELWIGNIGSTDKAFRADLVQPFMF